MMRKNLWALLALMTFFETEAEERNDPDTPAEEDQDGSDSNHEDSADNGNPNSNSQPSDPTSINTTPTPVPPTTTTTSPAILKAIRLVANAALQGFAFAAGTSIVAGEMLSFGISHAINYLWIRDTENRTDSFAFFGIARNNPFTGEAPTTVMPRLITLDKRQNHSIWFELYDEKLIDLNNNFDANNIRRIIEDTNDRHNREAPRHGVTTLTRNASNDLKIPLTNLEQLSPLLPNYFKSMYPSQGPLFNNDGKTILRTATPYVKPEGGAHHDWQHYPTFASPPHNPGFTLGLHANASIAPPKVSSFDADGNIVSHNIVTTNGYTTNDIQNGTRMFVLGHNRGKWSDKFSAVEIIVDHIYLLPLPLTPSNTLSVSTTMTTTVASGTSTPTTTPVKKARITSIDLD